MNVVIVSGNLGQDPELRQAGSKNVCNLRLAVNEGFGDKRRTHWLTVVAWDKQAELAHKYLRKGSPVMIEGRLSVREWDDKTGNKRRDVEVIAGRIEFGSRREGGEGGGYAGGSRQPVDDYPREQVSPEEQLSLVGGEIDLPF